MDRTFIYAEYFAHIQAQAMMQIYEPYHQYLRANLRRFARGGRA